MEENVCPIDDFGPLPLVQPQSIAELGDVVRRAASENRALYPVGGRTLLDIGLPPHRPGWAVDVCALARVLDYPARDMTITVEAGIAMAQLQALLATENQRLPIDIPHADQATLGGVLAANVSGPRRLGFGTLRDYVIGIGIVNDEGQLTKAGGRVVKNVAGYDLCKLHIGALGTLGIIGQVTLKLRPLPESKALIAFGCATAKLEGLLDRLHQTRTQPVCLDVLNGAAVRGVVQATGLRLPEAPWTLVVGFEDSDAAVNWQVKQLVQELTPGDIDGLEARAGTASEALWEALVESTTSSLSKATFKANMLPQAVASFCQLAATQAESIRLHAHAGSGIVRGHLDGDLTLPRFAAMLKELTDAAVRAEGNLVVPRCPVQWKRELPLWGRARGDWELMRQVKDKMDPRNLFNPDRFVFGCREPRAESR